MTNDNSFHYKIPSIPDGTDIYWDACFLFEYFVVDKSGSTRRKQRCDVFGDFLLFDPNYQFSNVTSDFAVNEALFIKIRTAASAKCEEEFKKGLTTKQDWNKWIKTTNGNGFISSLKADFEKLMDQIDDYLWIINYGLDTEFHLSSSAIDIMVQHDIMPTDAFHVALANHKNINRFVSLDEHFKRIGTNIVYYY